MVEPRPDRVFRGTNAALNADHRPVQFRPVEGEVGGKVTTHGTAYVDGSFEPQGTDELGVKIEEKRLVQQILFYPPLPRFGRQGLAVIGEIEGDDPVGRDDIVIVHQVAPLTAVGTGRMLADEGNALSVLFKVNTILDTLNIEVDVLSGDRFESCHLRCLLYLFCTSRNRSNILVRGQKSENASSRSPPSSKFWRIIAEKTPL